MPRSLTFDGAARTVTGSRHLIETDGVRILVDCGLFQGAREIRERNWEPFPFEPSSIDAVLLTHAHTDHVGLLPKLIKEGFRGPVYATAGTIAIANVSLPDGGRLQEEDARYHNRHRSSRHEPALPLFTESDAYVALKSFKKIHYYEPIELAGGVAVRYLPAGHILGASHVELTFSDGTVLVMSGDIGRYDRPILKDPSEVPGADYLVMESTYGDKLHTSEDPQARLQQVIAECARDKSVVIVPSFAIGRTQELLYYIHLLYEQNKIPRIPIFVDSPMANEATLLYATHTEDHDKEMKIHLSKGESPLSPDLVRFIRDKNASKALNSADGPMMIIAGSGMVNGGRVMHHLRQRLPDPSTVVLFTGYQAEGTRGRDLIEGAQEVNLLGDWIPVKARIEIINSLSAHADRGEMIRWLRAFGRLPKRLFLVHGDFDVQQEFAKTLEGEFAIDVSIPERQERFEF